MQTGFIDKLSGSFITGGDNYFSRDFTFALELACAQNNSHFLFAMTVELKHRLLRASMIFATLMIFIATITKLFTIEASYDPIIEFYTLIATGIVLTVCLPLLSPLYGSALTLVCVIPAFYIAYLYPSSSSIIDLDDSLRMILTLYSINILISYILETRQRQHLANVFGQYIPPELVTELNKNTTEIEIHGEARELTVFFCDLRNFSSISEQLNPKQVANLLNQYFTAMTAVLYKHGATIDKYIGDSIMAFWGAPIVSEDHAIRSIRASLEMHEEMKTVSQDFVKRGWPELSIGIGINTGMMNVGNMGSKYRVAYTVVGDAVNLAARLERLTRRYGTNTIVSQYTRHDVSGMVFRELDIVQVKGKKNLTKIYEPICLEDKADPALLAKLEKHQQGLMHYYAEEYTEAITVFTELNQAEPSDVYYEFMLDKLKSSRDAV